jgi:pimeloyl-ACP methyl ester carboxylesterase
MASVIFAALRGASHLCSFDRHATIRFEEGDEPLVLVPGVTGDERLWRRVVPLLSAMVAWYHTEGWGPAEGSSPAYGNYVHEVFPLTINVPTLVMFGDKDKFLVNENYNGLDAYVPDLTIRKISGGSHWILDEHPDFVNRHIREFLGTDRSIEQCKEQHA